jgi:hypothetical protein
VAVVAVVVAVVAAALVAGIRIANFKGQTAGGSAM